MRGVRYLIVVVLGLPLAGCFALPPKELPPWAMVGPVANTYVQPSYTQRAPLAPQRAHTAEVTHWPAPSAQEIKPFSPEWQAREDTLDNRLRRSMSICGGC